MPQTNPPAGSVASVEFDSLRPYGLAAHQAPLSCSLDNFTAIIHWMNRWMKKEGRKEDSCKEGRMERHKEKIWPWGWYSLEAFLKFIFKTIFKFLLIFKIFGHALWYVGSQFPHQGSNLHNLHWKLRVLARGPPGKSTVTVAKTLTC